ncbi:SRPBCC family protein [Aquabacterium sp. OR-4]|uniref:SRPBCC family protein n=1 Tax=Aquabacterium sp. OR-4 TaxID=2978127 RepID=UPI0028C76860|nr:SRPBCC domain-containing protein [Aquabacterium sp. OR-4]MDT7839042.1 SRPBCC domain-containing protein [Aquabacterium sp. OR-4]
MPVAALPRCQPHPRPPRAAGLGPAPGLCRVRQTRRGLLWCATLAAALACATAWPVRAQGGAAAPAAATQAGGDGVSDSSYRSADGERVLELSAEVAAPLEAVWAAFTTDAGFRRWAAPFARIDLRVDGEYEASYDPQAQAGAPGNIRNRILALVPLRLVVMRNVQAPPRLPFDAAAFQQTHTAIHFAALDGQRTRVTLQSAGYRDGEAFDGVYRHFAAGNRWTLVQLRKLFTTTAPAPAARP